MLDIRIPIGLMFTIKGIILMIYGAMSNPAIYVRSLGINVNFDWGAAMLVFGVAMLVLAKLTTKPAAVEPAHREAPAS